MEGQRSVGIEKLDTKDLPYGRILNDDLSSIVWATKANFWGQLGPFIMADVNHSPATAIKTTTALTILYPTNYSLFIYSIITFITLLYNNVWL